MSAVTLEAARRLNPCLPADLQGAALLTAATEWCEQHCGRKFDREAVVDERSRTVRNDAPGEIRHYIYLARPPVSAVTSVMLDEATIDASLYELVSDGGRAERIFLKTYADGPGSCWLWRP